MPPGHSKRLPANLLEHELSQEKASALGRLGRALESSLAAIATFDAAQPHDVAPCTESRRQRAALVREASVVLWHFVIQREACGFRDLRYVLQHYRVPPEVAALMGALPPARVGPASSAADARARRSPVPKA
jgi:hypothetical protein